MTKSRQKKKKKKDSTLSDTYPNKQNLGEIWTLSGTKSEKFFKVNPEKCQNRQKVDPVLKFSDFETLSEIFRA